MTATGTFDYSTARKKWYLQGWFSERTCIDAFETAAADHAQVPLVYVLGDTVSSVTIGELAVRAKVLAAALQRLGIRRGDRVAVQMTNRVETAVAYQAALLCGAVLVPIIHIYGVTEVAFILAESAAAVLIMPSRIGSACYVDRLGALGEVDTLRDVVVVDAQPGEGYLAWSELVAGPTDYTRPAVDSDDVCLLLYTSGTTSAPKGVQHTHNTVLAEQRTMPALLGGRPDDVSLVTFPPGHIAGVTAH